MSFTPAFSYFSLVQKRIKYSQLAEKTPKNEVEESLPPRKSYLVAPTRIPTGVHLPGACFIRALRTLLLRGTIVSTSE